MQAQKLTLALGVLTCALLVATQAGMAQAAITTHIAYPGQVPDETLPRGNPGDSPTGYGTSSWQGPATGKSNWHRPLLV